MLMTFKYKYKRRKFTCRVLSETEASVWYDSRSKKLFHLEVPSEVENDGRRYKVVEFRGLSYDCSGGLESIFLPNTVKKVVTDFCFCGNFIDIIVDPENENFSSVDGALLSKSGDVLLIVPKGKKSYIIPDTVKIIEEEAFYYSSNIKRVVIPDSVEEIKDRAFLQCYDLKEVMIPESVTYIGELAFGYCHSLKKIYIPSRVRKVAADAFYESENLLSIDVASENEFYSSHDGVLLNKSGDTLITCPEGKKEYVIPNGVCTIGENCFENCEKLSRVDIPETVTAIEKDAFLHCSRLESVKLPNSVRVLKEWIFSSCERLKTVILGDLLESIEGGAFYGCCKLREINIPDSVKSITYSAFDGCVGLKNLCFPKSMETLCVDLGCGNGTKKFEIDPENPYFTVVDGVLYDKSLSTLVLFPISKKRCNILSSVKRIGKSAFCDSKIKIFTIPDSVEVIEDSAFEYSSLTEISLSKNLVRIENSAFNSSDLKRVVLPPSLQYIGKEAFSSCYSLSYVFIPASVSFIGENAFRRDFAPKKEEIEVSPDNKVFSCYEGALLNHLEGRLIYCPKNKVSFSIPETVQIIGKYAFESCNKLKKVEIPTSIRVIEEGAFSNCRSLKHLVIPESVTDIGDCALEFCDDLESIVIPSSVENLSPEVFGSCDFPKIITIKMANPPEMNWDEEANDMVQKIRVPSELVELYKTADSWKQFAEKIEPIVE